MKIDRAKPTIETAPLRARLALLPSTKASRGIGPRWTATVTESLASHIEASETICACRTTSCRSGRAANAQFRSFAMILLIPDSSRRRSRLSRGMDTVYLLEHVHAADQVDEDVKTIGVYQTEAAAKAAIDRLGAQPGFRDHPEGWIISAKRLDQDSWSEGFGFDEAEEV